MQSNRLNELSNLYNVKRYNDLHKVLTVDEYVNAVYDKPNLLRSAYQRLFDCIMSYGTETFERHRKKLIKYLFFSGVSSELAVYGLEENLMSLMRSIKGAAGWYGPDRRLLLLHGPVGSSKSTICGCFKKGLELYSQTDEGEIMTFKWVNIPSKIYAKDEIIDPMRTDPIKLLPWEIRGRIESDINQILHDRAEDKTTVNKVRLKGELNPFSEFIWDELMKEYKGDWQKILEENVQVVRLIISESKRIGIGTFQPKDEKNQDSTELTGDISYTLLGEYGIDSDPRVFAYDGELQRSNRGIMEFIEVYKLAREFLYDLLGAAQEKRIKPKKLSQLEIDLVMLGHTNLPDYKKVEGDIHMEALRDRTIRHDIPYIRKWNDEIRVLEKDFNPDNVKQHIAPHTIKIAALVPVLSRLKQPKKGNMNLVDKAKLYNGEDIEGFNEDSVKELLDEFSHQEGMGGLSPRYAQNKFSNCICNMKHKYINGFMILNEMEEGLKTHALVENEDQRRFYHECIDLAKEEYEELIKKDVQDALVLDKEAMNKLLINYLDNVDAYVNKAKIFDEYLNREVEPNERLMRSVEVKGGILEQFAPDFRRTIQAQIGSLHRRKKEFDVKTNPKLEEALRAKLFEDAQDTINVTLGGGAEVVEPHIKEKIDAVKHRLINDFGYNEQSATDTLSWVGAIFARGDLKKKK